MALSATALVDLPTAKNFLRKDAASSLQILAEYVGMGDGADITFSLDHTPVDGSLKLYVNGTLQTLTSHYTISGANLTFVTAPVLNYPITASYDYAASDDTFEDYDDTTLEILINAATKKCEDYCGRAFIQRSITENRIGDGGKRLVLNKRPVNTFTSITMSGDALTEDTDFTLYKEEGALIRPTAISLWTENLATVTWPETAKLVITYNAGYASTRAATQALVPDAVLAVLICVASFYENRLGLKSQSVTGIGSQDFGEIGELPEQSKRLLSGLNSSLGIW
jgi:hypothetical protein